MDPEGSSSPTSDPAQTLQHLHSLFWALSNSSVYFLYFYILLYTTTKTIIIVIITTLQSHIVLYWLNAFSFWILHTHIYKGLFLAALRASYLFYLM